MLENGEYDIKGFTTNSEIYLKKDDATKAIIEFFDRKNVFKNDYIKCILYVPDFYKTVEGKIPHKKYKEYKKRIQFVYDEEEVKQFYIAKEKEAKLDNFCKK